MNERAQLLRPEVVRYKSDRSGGVPVYQQNSLLRWIIWICLGLAILALILLLVIEHRETESARGVLETLSGMHRVVAPVAATVHSIDVSVGQTVFRGQVLASLSNSTFDYLGNQAEQAEIRRLQRQRQLYRDESRLIERSYRQQLEQHQTLLQDLHKSLHLVETETGLLQQQLDIVSDNRQALHQLHSQAAISRSQLNQADLDHLAYRLRFQQTLQRSQAIRTELDQHSAQELQTAAQFEQNKLQIGRAIQQLDDQIGKLATQAISTVVAEADGVVASIATERGKSVRARQPLLTISSGENELFATLYVPSRLLGKLYPGQQLLLSYDAFDNQEYGRYRASITTIERASLDPRELLLPIPGIQEPVFKVSASLTQSYVEGPDIYRLQAGTLLSAEIVLAEMSLLEFIFKPVLQIRTRIT